MAFGPHDLKNVQYQAPYISNNNKIPDQGLPFALGCPKLLIFNPFLTKALI